MRIKNSKKYIRWLIELTVILLVLSSIQWWMTRDAVSGKAPRISGLLIDDTVYDSSKVKRPMLIYFWADWCPVCSFTAANVDGVAKNYEVITIAMQSGIEEINAYMKEKELSYKVINDAFGDLSHQFRVKGVPMFYILDSDKNIRFVERGYTSELGLRLRLWWAGFN